MMTSSSHLATVTTSGRRMGSKRALDARAHELAEILEVAGGYGPPGGGGYGGPPPGGGGYGPPPGGGGYGGPPPGGGGYGGPPPGGGGYGPPGGGYGPPPGGGFGGPPGYPMGDQGGGQRFHPLATTALVTGLASIPFCCCYFGVPLPITAIVCGIVGLNKIKASPQMFKGTGFCIAGIVCGAIMLLLMIFSMFSTIDDSLRQQYGSF